MKLWDPIARREREYRLEAASEIEEAGARLVVDARVHGQVPTPVEPILHHLGLQQVPLDLAVVDRYAHDLSLRQAAALHSALKKVSAWKDGRRICVHTTATTSGSQRKAAFHECGHELLSWHRISGDYFPTPQFRDLLEDEANAFAAAVLFQGKVFDSAAASLPIARESVVDLARKFGAPWHDTLIRFVERHREPMILLIGDGQGRRVVAASRSAVELSGGEDLTLLRSTTIESFTVGLKVVGVRRYELAVASRRSAGLVA